MNYSIIFTEISFYPEPSILLQIIRIIHKFRPIIKPEYDSYIREGDFQQIKKRFHLSEVKGVAGPLGPPF